MDFIVKLLFLGGKYISQAAGRTILEIYLKSKDISRHISLQYEKASEIIKPYDNMLELINDRAKETEDDVYIAQMNNTLKKQMEEHVNQMPKMLKSDYVNGLAKNDSILDRVKQWEQTYEKKQAVIEHESGFVEEKESDYDKIYTDLCTDLFRSSPIGVSICNLGLNNLGQTVNDFQENSKISKASDTNDLRKPSRSYSSQTFTEISDDMPKLHHAGLENLEVKVGHPNAEMFDFNASITKDKESEDGLGINLKSQMKYQVNFNANSWQYGKDGSYMKYLVEQSPANSYFNAKAIGIDSVEGNVSDKKQQSRSGCIQKIKRSNKLLNVDEIMQYNSKNIMRGLQQEIENRMLVIKKNKEHFKDFERNLHQKIIKSKIRQIANDVESRSSILTQNASHYSLFESKLEKNLKRKVNKILTKRKLSSGRISKRKEDLADNIKEISDLLKINDKEFRKLERKITQILLRRGLDSVLDVNYKEINKPVCKNCFTNSDEEDMRERKKILEINRKVFDKFEKDMSKIVILDKPTRMDKDDRLVSENFTKYHVNTNKLSSNVLTKNYEPEIKSDLNQPPLKRILSTRDKDDIRERANIMEANAKAFELFERCLKNTTTIKLNRHLQLSRNLTSKSGDRDDGKNKDGLFNEEKNLDDFNDDLESVKVIKTLKELLEKSSIFKAPKSYTRSNKINLSQTDFVKIKKGMPQKCFNKEKIPRYVSPVKTESQDMNKKKNIGVMNEKPKDYYEEYINKIKLKRAKQIEDKNNKSVEEKTQDKLKKFVRSTGLEVDEATHIETQTSLVGAAGNSQQEICKRNNKAAIMKTCDRQKEPVTEKIVNIQEKACISKSSENSRIPIFHKHQQVGGDLENTIDQSKETKCEEILPENHFEYSKQPQIKKNSKEALLKHDAVTSNFEDKIPTRSIIRNAKVLLAEIEETKIPLRNKSDVKKSKTTGRKVTSKLQYGQPLKDTKSESSITIEQTHLFNQNNKSCLSEQPSKLPRYTRNSKESSRSTSCLDNFKLDHDIDATNERLSRLDVTKMIRHNKDFRTGVGTEKSPPTRNIGKDDLLNVEKAGEIANSFENKIGNTKTSYSSEEVLSPPDSYGGIKKKGIQNCSYMVPPHSFKNQRESTSKVLKCMDDLREIEVEVNTTESYKDYTISQKARHLKECEFKKGKKKQNEEMLANFSKLEGNSASVKDIHHKIKKLAKNENEPVINSEEMNSVSSRIPQLKKIAPQAKTGSLQASQNCEITPKDREVKADGKMENSFLKKLENLNGVMNKAISACDSKVITASHQILKALEMIEKASTDAEINKLHKEPIIESDNLKVSTFTPENKSETGDKFQKRLNYTSEWSNKLKPFSKMKQFGESVSKDVGNVSEITPKKEKLIKVADNLSNLLRFAKDSGSSSIRSQSSKDQGDSPHKTLSKKDLNQEETKSKQETDTAIEKAYHHRSVGRHKLKNEANLPNPIDNLEKNRLAEKASVSTGNEVFSEDKVAKKLEYISKFRSSAINKPNINANTQNRIKELQKKREIIFPKISQNAGLTVGNKQTNKSPERLTNLNYFNNRTATDKTARLTFDKNEAVIKASSMKGTPNDSETSSKNPQNNSSDSFDDSNPKNKTNVIYNILKRASDDKTNGKKEENISKKNDGDKKHHSSDDGISVGKYHLKKIIAFVPEDIPTFEKLQKHYDEINKGSMSYPAKKECAKQKNDANLDSTKIKTSDVKTIEEKQSTNVTTEALKFSFIPRRSNADEKQKHANVREDNTEKSNTINKTTDEAKSSEKCNKNVNRASPATPMDRSIIKTATKENEDLNKQLLSISLEEAPAKKEDDKPVIQTPLNNNLKSKSYISQKEASCDADFKKTSIDTEVTNNKSEKITSDKRSNNKKEAIKTQISGIKKSSDDLPITSNERNIHQSKIAVRKETVKADDRVSTKKLGNEEPEKLVSDGRNSMKLEKTNALKKEVENLNKENMPSQDVFTESPFSKSVEEQNTSQSSKIVNDTDKINNSIISPSVTKLPFKHAKFSFVLPKKIIKTPDTNVNNKKNIDDNKEQQKCDKEHVPEASTTSVQSNIPLQRMQAISTLLKESLSGKLDDRERNKLSEKIKEICNVALGDEDKNVKRLSEKRSVSILQSDSHATRIPKSMPKTDEIEESRKLSHSKDHKPSTTSIQNKNTEFCNNQDENKVLSKKRSSTILQGESHATKIQKSIPKTGETDEIRKLPHSNENKPLITSDEKNKSISFYNTKTMKHNQPITENVLEQWKTTVENKTKLKSTDINKNIEQDVKGAAAQKYGTPNKNKNKNLKENQSPEPTFDLSMFTIQDDTQTKLDKVTATLRNQSAVRYNAEKFVCQQKTNNDNNSVTTEVSSTTAQKTENQKQLAKEKVDQEETENEENTAPEKTIVVEPGTLFRKAKFSFKPPKKSIEENEQQAKGKQNTQEIKVNEPVEEKQDPFPKRLSPLLRYFMHKRLAKVDHKQSTLKSKNDSNVSHEISATQKLLLKTNKQNSSKSINSKAGKPTRDVYARYPFLKKHKTRKKIPRCAWEWKMKFISQSKHKEPTLQNIQTEDCQPVGTETSRTKIKRSGNYDGNRSDSHKILTKIPTSKYSFFTGLPIHDGISKSHLKNMTTHSN